VDTHSLAVPSIGVMVLKHWLTDHVRINNFVGSFKFFLSQICGSWCENIWYAHGSYSTS